MQVSKGFTVRAFKGPTLPSIPFISTAKFDVGYRSSSSADLWQRPTRPTTPRVVPPQNPSPTLPDAPACYSDFEGGIPSVERQSLRRVRRSSSCQMTPTAIDDFYTYGHSFASRPDIYANAAPLRHSLHLHTPYAFSKPLTDSTETLLSTAVMDGFPGVPQQPPSSPPLSVRAIVPPQIPLSPDAPSGAAILGDISQGYHPPSVFDPFPCAPFLGLSNLPNSSGSDSDDGTIVAPEEYDGYKNKKLDYFGPSFLPPRIEIRPQGARPLPVPPSLAGEACQVSMDCDQMGRRIQPFPHPPRSHTDPGPTRPASVPPSKERPRGLTISTTTRSVRWNENLICPSPILPSQRRKGWYNRRGSVDASCKFLINGN